MIRVCAWCKRLLGEKEPLTDTRVTHGVCKNCHYQVFVQRERQAVKDTFRGMEGNT